MPVWLLYFCLVTVYHEFFFLFQSTQLNDLLDAVVFRRLVDLGMPAFQASVLKRVAAAIYFFNTRLHHRAAFAGSIAWAIINMF